MTPKARSRPELFKEVLSNKSNYYPRPVNRFAEETRVIFENGMPIYCPNTSVFQRDSIQRFYPRSVKDPNHAYDKYHGYISIPIGTPDFMVGTKFGAKDCEAPYV